MGKDHLKGITGKEHPSFSHGLSRSRFYKIWIGIKQRCLNINDTAYNLYGAKGIEICERWLIFENFMDDMYETYLEHVRIYGERKTSIDRINPKGNYEPDNCRWATPEIQASNKDYRSLPKRVVIKAGKPFIAISPNEETYQSRNQTTFAKEHDLDSNKISKVLRGERKHFRGWTFKFLEDDKNE